MLLENTDNSGDVRWWVQAARGSASMGITSSNDEMLITGVPQGLLLING